MTWLGMAVRWVHLASALALVGIFTLALLAGRSDKATVRAWEARVLALTRWLAVVLLLSGIAALAYQAAVATGRASALIDPAAWLRLLLHSQFGTIWMLRQGIGLLLAGLVLLREWEVSPWDWAGWRGEAWALAAAGAAALAWAGHAAAVEPQAVAAALADGLHIAAAGAWVGALLPLALLLRAASQEAGADARPFAVLAARRFSRLALGLMVIVIGTGICNAVVQVAGVPALVGTRYGWLLLGKLGALAAVLALAAVNRARLPLLSGEAATVGRPAMARLARLVAWECALALVILAVTSGLALTPPARHESPYWPFAHRLAYEALADVPGATARFVIGSQIAVLGLLGLIASALVKQRRGSIAAAGAAATVLGLWVALPPLAVDAYPTTYVRPSVPYQAVSIDNGRALFAEHCAICHGRTGTGDGPGGAGLPRRPADLTAPHTGQHTAGDLYWWITQGIPAAGMPGFGRALPEQDRWDVINFVRALSTAQQARGLGPVIERGRPSLVAPDFTFAVGPAPPQSLKELRGRSSVLLVLFSLPGSGPRLSQLAGAYSDLSVLGAEVIAVPTDADPRILTRLGGEPPIVFPVVTDGARDIVSTYALFRGEPGPDGPAPEPPAPRHLEFLIDRQGYIRARWIPGGGVGWSDITLLRAELGTLSREAPAPPPDEHVH
jgi:putative copper resistance protein D